LNARSRSLALTAPRFGVAPIGVTDTHFRRSLMLAYDYPFLDLFWTMLIFFCWVFWIWGHDGIGDREIRRARTPQAQMDAYIRATAGSGGAAAEIEKAKSLLDAGAITDHELAALKQRALV
jgi:hypothetical protein